jgi:hypothetical protein
MGLRVPRGSCTTADPLSRLMWQSPTLAEGVARHPISWPLLVSAFGAPWSGTYRDLRYRYLPAIGVDVETGAMHRLPVSGVTTIVTLPPG